MRVKGASHEFSLRIVLLVLECFPAVSPNIALLQVHLVHLGSEESKGPRVRWDPKGGLDLRAEMANRDQWDPQVNTVGPVLEPE